MNAADTLQWFESLLRTNVQGDPQRTDSGWYERGSAVAWLTEAHSALASVFQPGHPVIRQWQALVAGVEKRGALYLGEPDFVRAVRGVFLSAYNQLKSGRLGSIVDGILAESVGELLEQARFFNEKGYVVAAAVLAGGALESHLLHLCRKNKLSWPGDGSISKYDAAVAQARNAGDPEIYSAAYSKLVAAWGGIRNDAAHKPAECQRSASEISSMITGILEFLARHP